VQEKNQKDSFIHLDPELVLEATESAGLQPTGEFTQLNSYENRVFDIRLEQATPSSTAADLTSLVPRVIAKFYRPGRWSKDCILEEHRFLQNLQLEGLHVAAPLVQKNGSTLATHKEMHVAFFPKIAGRMPQEFTATDLEQVGRQLALLHNVGAKTEFKFRPILGETPHDPWSNLDFLVPWIAPEMKQRYVAVAEELFSALQENIDFGSFQPVHGDCHRGNLLHSGKSGPEGLFFFVDFDDCMQGPVVQDLWMLFSSLDYEVEKNSLMKGYETLREFPHEQWSWIPLLRGLRIVNYAAWIARRWSDPSFPRLFPLFKDYNYWAEEVEALEKIVWSFN